VVATPREVLDEVAPGVRVRYRRSEPPPPYTYAITLELKEEDTWRTARLWDNADDVNEHHVHRYTQQEGKGDPEILEFKSVNEAMAAAKKEARERWAEIVRQWLQS
jgi:hypothetical protein